MGHAGVNRGREVRTARSFVCILACIETLGANSGAKRWCRLQPITRGALMWAMPRRRQNITLGEVRSVGIWPP